MKNTKTAKGEDEMNTVLLNRNKLKKKYVMPANNDPFYSRSNIEYLEKVTSEIDAGIAKLEEHELIEV